MLFEISTLRSRVAALGIAVLAAPVFAQTQAGQSERPPDELFASEGTVLTVEISDYLSSDKNQTGDTFVAALRQPLVIDGWVVARAGQTVFGQVASANKAGRKRGTSDLALELTEIVLVDGQQLPIRTLLLANHGPESHGEDAATIAGASVVGSIIGAAIGEGKGAIIGAGIGAAAGTAGVLSTRGKATEIQPESKLTFRLDAPLIVSTVRSSRAFQPVAPEDYPAEPTMRNEPRSRSVGYRDRNYPRVYDGYPRFPRYPGPHVGVVIVP